MDWDRYAYISNNPVNGTDPSGHFIQLLAGTIIGAVVGVAIVAATHPNLSTNDYVQAALVGATAGLLISTGVGVGVGSAIGATLLGAGVGAATSAAGYAITAGDSYNSQEMTANAAIGFTTGALSALTGPAVVPAAVAKSGGTLLTLARAGINALGTNASQIIHNEYFDDDGGKYPTSGGELAGGAAFGATTSLIADGVDGFVNGAVTFISGSKAAGQIAESVTYNFIKNLGSNFIGNQGSNLIDCWAEGGGC